MWRNYANEQAQWQRKKVTSETKQFKQQNGCANRWAALQRCIVMPSSCSMTDLLKCLCCIPHRCVSTHSGVFLRHNINLACFKETNTKNSQPHPGRRVTQSLQTLYKWISWLCVALSGKTGAGLWYTICPKCLCKGYALGLSHSILHDCSLHLRFHFALWYRKPCIEACSSAASLQWPHWGRDPERMHGARRNDMNLSKKKKKTTDTPFWIGMVNMQSTIHCCLRA